jgi:aminoacrylate hydrolase
MPTLDTNGISLYYELHGNPSNAPVLLLTGLGGVGKSWGSQIQRFAESHYVIVPDHRGTGQTTHAPDGYTTQQLADDMASLVEQLALGPVHVVGSSTGGAIAQYMALDHPRTMRSLTMSSSFAHLDSYAQREFAVRRKIAAEWDPQSQYAAYALFLFSPRFTREHPEKVTAWIERASAHPAGQEDREIALKRIDMVVAHDTRPYLADIRQPSLVLCGDHNFCTPLPLSEEIVRGVPGAELVVFEDSGELIELEREEDYFRTVTGFLARH